MENNHDIDKAFNEASKNLEEPATFPGFDKVWTKVEERLDKKEEKKRKVIPVWIPYGIAASLLIVSGIFYFTGKKQNKQMRQEIIADQMNGKEDVSAEPLVQVQKIDRMVKMNIQNKTLPVPSEKIIAYQSAPKLKTDLPASSIAEMNAPVASHEEAEKKMMAMDSLRRHNIEEVIAMGIKKEKASMGALASSQKVSNLNTMGDTAESSYPNLAFNLKEKETEIKSYNKVNTKAQKPLAFNPITENRLAEKADTSRFKIAQGSHTNIVSGRSNKGDSPIIIRGTSQANQQNPMVVIDGKVSDMETFKTLDSKKIDEITILKGERAASLFSGEKARNGVIVVITKSISRKEKKKLKKLLENMPENKP